MFAIRGLIRNMVKRSIRRWCGQCPVLCFCHGMERATEQMALGRPECRKAVADLNNAVRGFLPREHKRRVYWGAGAALICAAVLGPPTANATMAGAAPETATTTIEELADIMVEAPEPRYVSPTRRDQIGRIWAPVMINGHGPFRLVLDTGASHSAVTSLVALALGIPTNQSPPVVLR